jgi:hypothetical protein
MRPGHATLRFQLWGGKSPRVALPHLLFGFDRDRVYRRIEQLRQFTNAVMNHYAIFDKAICRNSLLSPCRP